jgi:N-alpha-acetyltransferase 30
MSSFPTQDFEDVEFVQYTNESMLPDIQRLVQADLSEPYSVFVYRYFIHQWPKLCTCLYSRDLITGKRGEMIGTIVCKAEDEQGIMRGYIAMLAVNKTYRGRGLGLKLANIGIEGMKAMNCTEIMLEAEECNSAALSLYDRLGFVRDERLGRYYLNGSGAYRLKLWIGDGIDHEVDYDLEETIDDKCNRDDLANTASLLSIETGKQGGMDSHV